uniref:AlNc14C52G4038 protein n=1 Tax=Albugo laibachii Nc14 TaxID=890382 RepID=F0WBJ2_9STRA|nr:AlNc14C52G4038 [Albugo laibachii Nc14]|eukprot:CCA18519.1 AlNc14C52G4038 [Albugo laibachii Nc14]
MWMIMLETSRIWTSSTNTFIQAVQLIASDPTPNIEENTSLLDVWDRLWLDEPDAWTQQSLLWRRSCLYLTILCPREVPTRLPLQKALQSVSKLLHRRSLDIYKNDKVQDGL